MMLLYLFLAWLAGVAMVRWLFPAPLKFSPHNILLLGLGAGVGIGVASSIYFLCLVIAGPDLRIIVFAEVLVLVLALAAAFLAKQRSPVLDWAPGPAVPMYLVGIFSLAALTALVMFVMYSVIKPHGEWDAWSIWNMRARFLYRGGQYWTDAFSSSIGWTHPDYPLLLPGIIALCWTLAKTEWVGVQAAVAFLFVFGGAAVLIATLGILRGKAQALIAGTVLLGTVFFVQVGAMQYADVPLSFYILAALALLCLQDRYPEDLRFTILAGVAAGFAAWTKNEGLLFVAALILARAHALFHYGARENMVREFIRLGAGLAGPLAVVALFKLRYAPPNDLVGRKPGEILSHLTQFSRWMYPLEGYVKMIFRFGGFLIPIVVVLALYWFLVRFKVAENDRRTVATAVAAIAIMLAGDFAVYVLLPADVVWQLNTSLDRIFLQLWPAGLLAFFLATNPPQLVAEKEPEKHKPEKRAAKTARR